MIHHFLNNKFFTFPITDSFFAKVKDRHEYKLTYSLEEDPEAKVSNTLDMLRKVPMITVDGDDNIQLKGSGNFKIYLNG